MPADPHRPTIPEVLPVARAYVAKSGNSVGGSLHLVLDDPNYDDGSVRYCLELARERDDQDGIVLAHLLLAMTRTQRSKLARQLHAPAGA